MNKKNVFPYIATQSSSNIQQVLQNIQNKNNAASKTVDSTTTGVNYYPLNSNYFSGMLINFKRTKFTEKKDINNNMVSVRSSELSYYGATPIDEKQQFLSFDYNSFNPLLPDSYSLYFKPNLNKNQLQWYKDQIEPIFNNNLYEMVYSILIYNMDYKLCYALFHKHNI